MVFRKEVCGLVLTGFFSFLSIGGCAAVRRQANGDVVAPVREPRPDTARILHPLPRIATPPATDGSPIELASARASTPSSSPQPEPPNHLSEVNSADKLRQLYRQAAGAYAAIDSYIVRLRRREEVNGKQKPEEVLLVKFRKNPWSIYFKWLGPVAHGREVIYVSGKYENKIHTLLAAGDMPLMPAGRQIALDPDSPLVRGSSRHSIREAGIGNLIERLGHHLDAAEKGDGRASTIRYLGLLKRPEFDKACEAIEEIIPAGAEALLPHGGKRLWVFDPACKLPALIITHNETGREVEYYCYDRFLFPVRLDEADFNPEVVWKPGRQTTR